ncbi:MAG: YqgE/AlgH family protein [Thermoanaerobaculia bacterium]
MRAPRPSFWFAALVVAVGAASAASGATASALAKGKLLVAGEDLHDPNFFRTVVLLLEYGDSGALGVVLNRPSEATLTDLMPDHEWTARLGDPVYLGGPVALAQAMMVFMTGRDHMDQMQVLEGIHAGWDLDLLERMLVEPRAEERVRIYVGYAGWGPGQLEAEVARGGWHVFPASESTIFSDDEEELWQTFIERTRTRIASPIASEDLFSKPEG